jgi:transcription termination/antitermination protein NusA
MKSDFMLAINQLCTERKLSREVVLEAVEAALISAYKRNFGSATNIEATIEPNTGDARIFSVKEVVEAVQDQKTQVSLADARLLDAEVQLGGTVRVENTPRDFGRIAAQTAKQVILQRIREAERDVLFSSLVDKAGEIAHGTVQSLEYHTGDIIVNVDGAEAVLPAKEQVSSERYRRGARIKAYVQEVRRGSRGPQITLSRRSPHLLSRLLELEVPEIFNGTVEIKSIAREAGSRSKVAVHATQEGVDPVGSCVGVRGGRIQNVVNELAGEKIDVVQWDSDVANFIANSLSPAKVMNVRLEDNPEVGKTATVIVPDRQLSLAIGKEGQNARLAAKLTGWRIDIKSATETAEETLGRYTAPVVPMESMDLLTLAETILRDRDPAGFTEEERALLDVVIEGEPGEGGAGVPWPAAARDERPAAELVPEGTGEAAEMGETAQRGPVAGRAAAEPPDLLGRGPSGTEAALPALVEERTGDADVGRQAGSDEGSVPRLTSREEEEMTPPFEGEAVEDSFGWVATEPAAEYKYDWPVDEVALEPEWEEEAAEEESPVKAEKKKRKKSRAKFGYEDSIDAWRERGGKTRR